METVVFKYDSPLHLERAKHVLSSIGFENRLMTSPSKDCMFVDADEYNQKEGSVGTVIHYLTFRNQGITKFVRVVNNGPLQGPVFIGPDTPMPSENEVG